MINCGALLAFTLVAYVQQNVNFWLGYLLPTVSMVVAGVVFLLGRNVYVHRPPTGSLVVRTLAIVQQGARVCTPHGLCSCCSCLRIVGSDEAASPRHNSQLGLLADEAGSSGGGGVGHNGGADGRGKWLDRAKITNGGSFTSTEVDEVKELGRTLPVLATFIVYWLVDNQVVCCCCCCCKAHV